MWVHARERPTTRAAVIRVGILEQQKFELGFELKLAFDSEAP